MKKYIIYLYSALVLAGTVSIVQSAGAQSPQLQKIYSDNTYQFTGVGVSKNGRVFVTYPYWSNTYKYAVVEVMPDGSSKPFPDAAMNSWKKGEDGTKKWVCVQTAYVDADDYLYIVDPAAPFLSKVQGNGTKVVKFDLKTNKPVQTYRFTGTVDDNSYINDIRVDTKKQIAYLTNSGEGGIVILDLKTGKSRQVLEADKFTLPDPNHKFIIDGKEFKKQGQPAKFNSDGIALTPDGDWLYYKTINDKILYRIKTSALLNLKLTKQQLSGSVQNLGEVVNTDGMIFDPQGTLYLGDIVNYRMVKLTPELKASVWFKSPLLIWPDTYSIANGYLYITTSQINKQPDYNNEVNKRTSPYVLYKVKL